MTTSLDAGAGDPSPFDPQQPSHAPTFEIGLVVPVQFYDLTRRSAFLDGEPRLVFAVLEDAVRTYLRQRDSRRRADRVEFAEVERWLEARNGNAPFPSSTYARCLNSNLSGFAASCASWNLTCCR
jgi:hypothetical protein